MPDVSVAEGYVRHSGYPARTVGNQLPAENFPDEDEAFMKWMKVAPMGNVIEDAERISIPVLRAR